MKNCRMYGLVAVLISALILACEATAPATPAPTEIGQVSSTEVPSLIEQLAPTLTATPLPPSSSFSVDVGSGGAPLTVNFSNVSDGPITSREWDLGDGSTSTDQSPSHRYTLAGTYTIQLKVTGPGGIDTTQMTDLIIVSPGSPFSLEVSPSEATLAVQEGTQFTTVALDEFGNEVPLAAIPEWAVVAEGGSIDTKGRFIAATQAGSFTDTIKASLQTDTGELGATASVTVEPGPLFNVLVEPTEVTLNIGATQPFGFSALDEFGNQISDALSSWSTPASVGEIDAEGLLTVGTKAGIFQDAIRVDVVKGTSRASGAAKLSVDPDPLDAIDVQPTFVVVEKGSTQQFTAVSLDQFGNVIPDLAFLWESTGGQINQSGLFTAVGAAGPYPYLVTASATSKGEVATGSATFDFNLAPNPSFEEGVGTPEGWTTQRRQTDATFEWDTSIVHDGGHSLKITASQPAQEGWPGLEAQERIPVDSEKISEFSVWYYVTDIGLSPWMEIQSFDSAGKGLGLNSTGAGPLPLPPNQWLNKVYIFNPSALHYSDIAEVKLVLRISLNYKLAGIPEGTVTAINYDDLIFRIAVPKRALGVNLPPTV